MLWCFNTKFSGRNSSARPSAKQILADRPDLTRMHDSHDFDEDRTEFDFDQKREMVLDHSKQQPGVEFAVSLEPQPLRLIELPPQLLEEIEQRGTTLQLKSLNGDVSNSVVLCSATQTFAVRQNQSSNTLFVTETATGYDHDDGSSRTFVRAMAQPRGMLEISPSKPDAVAYLKEVLPVLQKDHLHPETGRLLTYFVPSRTGYEECLRSAPFSRGEFADACELLCAFEFENSLWLPSPELALEAWKAILYGASENATDAGAQQISFTLSEIESSLNEYNLPTNLYKAVAERTCSFLEQEATLEPEEYGPWVGMALLNGIGESGIDLDAFMGKWRDCLPLAARTLASLEHLKSKYELSEDGSTISRAGLPKKAPLVNGGGAKTNKWHEKLRAARR